MSQFETQDESHERLLRENESLRGLLASAMANGGTVAGKLAAENSILKAERDKARAALDPLHERMITDQRRADDADNRSAALLVALKNLIDAAEAVLEEDRDRRWIIEKAIQEDGCFVGVGRGPVNDVARAWVEHLKDEPVLDIRDSRVRTRLDGGDPH
jgi:hypothetical protein